jgi:CHAD domain-containing protein
MDQLLVDLEEILSHLNRQGMSEQLAKMAAQQEALRRQMQQMMDKIKKEGLATIIAEWKVDGGGTLNIKITPELALKILKRISDEDVTFMGFNPLW